MKAVKWLAVLGLGAILLYAAWIGVTLFRLPPVAGLVDPKMNLTIQVKDWQGELHPFVVGPRNPWWTPAESIPPETQLLQFTQYANKQLSVARVKANAGLIQDVKRTD